MSSSRVFAFIFLVGTLPGAGCLELDVLCGASGGMHVAVQEGLDAGLQSSFASGLAFQALTASGFGGGFSLGMSYVWASPVVDLVSYRGYWGGRLALFGAWQLPWRDQMILAPGVRAGILGSYSTYLRTDLYFVAPGLFVAPTLSLRLKEVPWLAIEAALPVIWARRADLRFSGEAGLALSAGLRLSLPRAAAGGTDG